MKYAAGLTGNRLTNLIKTPFDIQLSGIEIHFMPLYEYELCEGDCKVRGGKIISTVTEHATAQKQDCK